MSQIDIQVGKESKEGSAAPAIDVVPQAPQSQSNPPPQPPKSLHCLVCRCLRPVTDVQIVDQPFISKSGKQMTRSCWKGTCDHCHRKVNQFAKKV